MSKYGDESLQQYLNQISKYKVLTEEEEKELFEQYQKTKSQEIKEKILNHNLKLVVSVAKVYAAMIADMSLMDLIMEGNIGMMTAVDKFDLSFGCKFSTYATQWIRQSITRAICNQCNTIRIPVHAYDIVYKIKRYTNKYAVEHDGEFPDAQTIAEELNMDPEQVEKYRALALQSDTVSLNTVVGETEHREDTELGDFVADETAQDPFLNVENDDLRNIFLEILSKVNWDKKYKQRNIEIVIHRFGLDGTEPETLESVANRYGLTRERTRQIEAKFLRLCRAPKYRSLLKDFRK